MEVPNCGTLSVFYLDALWRSFDTNECYGEACIGQLLKIRPDLAEKVIGTDKDISLLHGPKKDPERWNRFALFVETNWYNNDSKKLAETDQWSNTVFAKNEHN